MKRTSLLSAFIALITLWFPTLIKAEGSEPALQIAFIREGNLWLKKGDQEEQITTESNISSSPQWSHDGKWVLYQKKAASEIPSEKTQSEIWVYHLESRKHIKVFYNGTNPKWAPNRNVVAFQDRGVLNVSDLKRFYNAALGVDSYTWYPDGSGCLASSSATLRPDGWTHPILYKINLEKDLSKISSLTQHVQTLFVIPKELSVGDEKNIAITAHAFAFSPDQEWVSFIVSPTASLSMDSNMLCVLSLDGKKFNVLDEVIKRLDDPKWSEGQNQLGYIAGGGRIIFNLKNKDLKVTQIPSSSSRTLTPPNYAEMGFDWLNNTSLVVSRIKESVWSDDPKQREQPSLYIIDIEKNEQRKISSPKGKGDYRPRTISFAHKLVWERMDPAMSIQIYGFLLWRGSMVSYGLRIFKPMTCLNHLNIFDHNPRTKDDYNEM